MFPEWFKKHCLTLSEGFFFGLGIGIGSKLLEAMGIK